MELSRGNYAPASDWPVAWRRCCRGRKNVRTPEFQAADEIFPTGNYSKVVPVTRIDNRPLPMGPFYTKARELYWAFAHS